VSDADLDDVVRDCRAANAITEHLEQSLASEVARRRSSGRSALVWGIVGVLVGSVMVLATWSLDRWRPRVLAWTTLISGALSITRGLILLATRSALTPYE
jgi:hypothetical protein